MGLFLWQRLHFSEPPMDMNKILRIVYLQSLESSCSGVFGQLLSRKMTVGELAFPIESRLWGRR